MALFLSNKDRFIDEWYWGVKLCHAYLVRSRGVLRGFVVGFHHAP
ncbi:hypothetical protein HPHPH9_1448 [Helicobacter pylori Hp H-9]|nr:hypothetical protein HPHPH9_1448 [Helicobacter pylori Hp H-9]